MTSYFSFSHSVFKRLVSQGRQKKSLCGNGLILYLLVIHCCILVMKATGKHCTFGNDTFGTLIFFYFVNWKEWLPLFW